MPWRQIFTSGPVWAIIVANFCVDWGLYTYLTNIPTFFYEVLFFDIQSVSDVVESSFIYLTDLELCETCTNTHTHTRLTSLFSGTIGVSRYQKGKTNLDFTGARDSEWQWHQLGHMQFCTSLQTDNSASTPPLSFYRLDALLATQPAASMH